MALTDASDRLRVLSAAHALLKRGLREGLIPLHDYLTTLCAGLTRSETCGAVAIEAIVESVHCPPDLAIPVGLLAGEAISNAMKHAFPGGRDGRITVLLQRLDGGLVRLTVEDDGVGRDPAARDGLGHRLIRNLAEQLGALLEITSAPGRGCTIRASFVAGPCGRPGS